MIRIRPIVPLVLLFGLTAPVFGQQSPSSSASQNAIGPATVSLGNNLGQLKLPSDFAFIGREDAKQALQEDGETNTANVIGLVGERDSRKWMAILEYKSIGYVKDDEADQLSADNLLNSLKEGTQQENEEKRKRGLPTLSVVGWHIPPHYDKGTHTLTWSVIGQEDSTGKKIINYTSDVLGRAGIMTTTVVGDYNDAAEIAPKLQQVSSSINFTQGQDYASFRPGDRISELTMTGLVTGGAAAAAYGAAKMGLLGKIGVFLLALKKGIVFIVLGLVGVVKAVYNKITGRSGDQPAKTTV